jgi:hypothetical protein
MSAIPVYLYGLGILAFAAVVLNWAQSTGKLGIFLSSVSKNKEKGNSNTSPEIYSPENISTNFEYQDVVFPLISMQKIKSINSEIGGSVYRIKFNDSGNTRFVDVEESRLEIPIIESVLRGEELLIRYRGDVEANKYEVAINRLRDKINELKAQLASYSERIKEMQTSSEYQQARSQQREGAVRSSRTFGGGGARYSPVSSGNDDYDAGDEE